MNKKEGVSMVALVITIVVILIIIAIGINNGVYQNIQETYFTKIYSEMNDLSKAVSQRKLLNEMDKTKYALVGEQLSESNSQTIDNIRYGNGFWIINTDVDRKELKLEKVENDYIVNYDTGEVISFLPIVRDSMVFYTLSSIKEYIQ